MGTLHKLYDWFDERLSISRLLVPLLRHPVPRSVNWWYVFGSATLVAFVVQVVTGVTLAFAYVPSPDNANGSIRFITNTETLGHIVRGIHYWGASAMVVLIFVHLSRVFLTGSYKYPRELNWLVGVGLFFLTLGMAFTGQLLRWDQDAYWAVVVGAEQAGRVPWIGDLLARLLLAGKVLGGATLTRFYATHVFLIPALIITLIVVHLHLVVQLGISEPPKAGEVVNKSTYRQKYRELLHREGVPFWPDVVWRDVLFAVAVVAVIICLAIFVGPKAPGQQADPTIIKTYPRPDWYFLWYFALLALLPPAIESWVIVGLPLVVLVGMLITPFVAGTGERSPRRRPWALVIVGGSAIAIFILVRVGNKAPWSPNLSPPPLPTTVSASLQSDDQRDGAVLFEQEACLACHTVGGVGGKRGPNLTNVGGRLSEVELKWRIASGGKNMPPYGSTLTSAQLDQIVAFLEAQHGP